LRATEVNDTVFYQKPKSDIKSSPERYKVGTAMVHVTRFEPEVVRSIAQRFWSGSLLKVATTPMKTVIVFGVILSSRYQKADDLERMGAMLEGVDRELRCEIAAIWCDSEETRTYIGTLKGRYHDLAKLVAAQLETASGSHKGIVMEDPARSLLWRQRSNNPPSATFRNS
jgi:hypothetical protein